ncbi:MAG: hypothetical protein V4633_04040 [Pseudomonadota bacterium]
MSFSDETLMAYADGELDDITRHEVELAMRLNPDIAAKVNRHKALRSNVFNAFGPVLDEEVPQRLQASARSGKVVHLDSVRPLRAQPPAPAPERKPRWSWPQWGALAATLVVGVLAGSLGLRNGGDASALAAIDQDGPLRARGVLAEALSTQLASAPGTGEVTVGVSFLAKDGSYCRSFMMPRSAGLACREGGQWKIAVMVDNADVTTGAYRQALSAMPAAVADAIDERITGSALDGQAESVARQQGWVRKQ